MSRIRGGKVARIGEMSGVTLMKRQRGRGGGGGNNNMQRRPGGGHNSNRSFDSNGPDVKVRGPAPVIYERYLQLARDATTAGDRVMAENFLQHAEHYFRVLRAMAPAQPPPQMQERFGEGADFEDGEEGGEEMSAEGEQPRGEFQQREQRNDYQQRDRGEYREQRPFREQREQREPREPRGDYQQQQREPRQEFQPREPRPDAQPREDRGESREPREPREGGEVAAGAEGEDGYRRNRRRRNRFRGDERGPRPEGEGAPRESNGPQEGFGDSLPAFLNE